MIFALKEKKWEMMTLYNYRLYYMFWHLLICLSGNPYLPMLSCLVYIETNSRYSCKIINQLNQYNFTSKLSNGCKNRPGGFTQLYKFNLKRLLLLAFQNNSISVNILIRRAEFPRNRFYLSQLNLFCEKFN